MTDGKGKIINFKNSIIVLTSNVGSEYFREISKLGFSTRIDVDEQKNKTDEFKERVEESLKETFRPEFLNRLDEIIIFNPLGKKEIEKIIDLQLGMLKEKLANRGFEVTVDNSLRRHIAEAGFDPDYGARPIKRMIQKLILDELANRIIKGELKDAKKIKLGFKGEHITIGA